MRIVRTMGGANMNNDVQKKHAVCLRGYPRTLNVMNIIDEVAAKMESQEN